MCKEALHSNGWELTHLGSRSPLDIVQDLGVLINKASIRVDKTSNQFIHGNGYVEYHTDDPRARYILWVCHKQADVGGENLLVDLRAVHSQMPAATKRGLERLTFIVNLPGAPVEVNFLNKQNGLEEFYYASWKKGSVRDEEIREALFYFSTAVARHERQKLLMNIGDVLIVDNKRMAHGRLPYAGDERHLERYLIA